MMKKRVFVLMALILGLVMAFTFTGCGDKDSGNSSTPGGNGGSGSGGGNGGGADTWVPYTNQRLADGTWKGSQTRTYTESEAPYSNVTITSTVNVTFNVSGGQYTSGTMTMTMKHSGGNIAAIWPQLKQGFTLMPGATVKDSDYSVTFTQPMTSDPTDGEVGDEGDAGDVFINQSNTKIKIVTRGEPDFIMAKQ